MIGPVFPSVALAADLIPGQLEVFKDVKPTEFEISDLRFVTPLKKKEDSIEGEELCRRAVKLHANLGLVDAKRLLAHRRKIPANLRNKEIVFTGTKLRNPMPDGNNKFVWVGVFVWRDEWYLDFHFLTGALGCCFTNCNCLPCIK